ncbi:hypothetical protein GCM10017083_43900 [Thalassobaculum fulvum]|uniref:Uncharacterized protein n=1 Tax=Thalassobaculum fulvum TaxID=1633335 RepID=A0A918XVH0_9PROT|nr:hypothetical protein [Thalassobaculum fulvum]GHD59547.1 hypothetical protein GCM10017083_43900 [Thalassobaculum fulvum]
MPDASQPVSTIADYDRDSIHILPLSVLPLGTHALARARLIRNHRLETRVELFRETGGGSGQIAVDEVPDFFPGDAAALAGDLALLRRLGELPAFDPYTLRIGLRRAGVNVLDLDALQLSPARRAELRPLMSGITRPLVAHLYGAAGRAGDGIDAFARAIENPATPAVRRRIMAMAAALRVGPDALPGLIEDYGDTYLALSYYRGYLMHALPVVGRILGWIREVRLESFLRTDPNVQRSFQRVEGLLNLITTSVTRRFNDFDRQRVMDWGSVTIDSFEAVRRMVSTHQDSLARVLCGLTVKIHEWEQRFPNGGGSPEKRADFVISDLRPGLDTLWRIESDAARRGVPNRADEGRAAA